MQINREMEETCIKGSHIKWKRRLLRDKIGPWGGDLGDVQKKTFRRQQSFFTGEIFFDPMFLEMSQNFRAKNVLSNLKNFPVFDDLTKHRQIDFVLRKSPRSTTDDVSRLVLNSKFQLFLKF